MSSGPRLQGHVCVLSILICLLAVSAGTGNSTSLTLPGCTGQDLAGVFTRVPGSAGHRLVSYSLRLTDKSAGTCILAGLPVFQLLDSKGRALPGRAGPADISVLRSRVVIHPGRTAAATAQLSPDFPGLGEPRSGSCEPTAYTLRLAFQSGGTTLARIDPPTPVCDHGRISLTAFQTV